MKKLCTSIFLAAAVAVVGCEKKGTQGGPGATGSKPVIGQGEETFALNVPNLSTKVKQGEAKEISVSIRRGRNFDEDVSLKFDNVPKGVSFEPASPVLKKGNTDVKFMVKAAEDAAVGDFTVRVTGNPTKGSPSMNELKLTVEKK